MGGPAASGGTGRERPPVGTLKGQRSFRGWFLILLLVVLLFLFISYNSVFRENFYGRLFNRTSLRRPLPPYRVHPKHRMDPEGGGAATEAHTAPLRPAGPRYHQAYPRNYNFIVDVADACKDAAPFVVLMVPVEPGNTEARDAIRQTWGEKKVVQGQTVLTLFVLGVAGGSAVQEKVREESERHGDLVQSDFVDSYVNLTIKTMVIMDWLATRCPSAAYAMKVDSDLFLNIDNLVLMLQKPGVPKAGYLTGMLMENRPVIRSKNSKWFVPEEMFPEPQYPTYTLGMGYVFSNDLPQRFVEISKTIKPFNIEDAYIGMCMLRLGLRPVAAPQPSQFRAYNTQYDRCQFSKTITCILASSQQLLQYWADLHKPEPPCS